MVTTNTATAYVAAGPVDLPRFVLTAGGCACCQYTESTSAVELPKAYPAAEMER